MSTYSPTAAQKQTFECRRTAERSHKRASYRASATREKAMAKFRDAWMKVIETRREPRPV
jgi:hypothetical protein